MKNKYISFYFFFFRKFLLYFFLFRSLAIHKRQKHQHWGTGTELPRSNLIAKSRKKTQNFIKNIKMLKSIFSPIFFIVINFFHMLIKIFRILIKSRGCLAGEAARNGGGLEAFSFFLFKGYRL